MVSKSIVNILFGFVTLIMFFSGISKIYDLSPKYIEMIAEFRDKVTPAWQVFINNLDINYTIDADLYRQVVGYTELFGVLLMVSGYRQYGAMLLCIIMIGASYTHVLMNDSPTFPMILCLFCFVIANNSNNKNKKIE